MLRFLNYNHQVIKNNVLICDFEADGFRLPTLEEWDFVAKGGGKKEAIPIIDREWYNANSKGSIHDVATKKSNILEIYDNYLYLHGRDFINV